MVSFRGAALWLGADGTESRDIHSKILPLKLCDSGQDNLYLSDFIFRQAFKWLRLALNYIEKNDPKLPILRPPSLKFWDYRPVLSHQILCRVG